MDFLHSCTAGILEQKHLQPIFVYGDISGYLSVFFFFFSFLGGDLFISKCDKHRDGFPFTHRAICLHFRVKITFLLSGGKDRQVMSNTTEDRSFPRFTVLLIFSMSPGVSILQGLHAICDMTYLKLAGKQQSSFGNSSSHTKCRFSHAVQHLHKFEKLRIIKMASQ